MSRASRALRRVYEDEIRSPKRVAGEYGDEFANYHRTVEDVPINWLQKLEGNWVNPSKVAKIKEDIRKNGIKSPLIINVGKKSRTAELGEGNHRLAALAQLGFTHAPARVVVGREWGKRKLQPKGIADDIIPQPDQFFSEDSAPSQVFKSLAGATR